MGDERTKDCCTAVLLAAGKGNRMGADVPKQYMDLGGMPLMMHSLRTLTESDVITDIVMVVQAGDEEYCAQLCAKYALSGKVRALVPGGKERYDSVYNGLTAINWPCDYVFIHDSARPYLTDENLRDLYREVCIHKACVAAVPSKDTVKISNADGFVDYTPVRSNVWIVQTPQVFDRELITEAYRKMKEDLCGQSGVKVNEGSPTNSGAETITDDAMVAERYANCRVKLVMASYRNIKITTPEDMMMVM